MNPNVDFYFTKAKKWQDELLKLRSLVLECDLSEELKWGVPCYVFQKSNIVLIHVFKDYFALLFHKGALLKDEQNILIQQTENTQAARQIRFVDMDDILKIESTIKEYIFEAIEVDKAGLKVNLKKPEEFNVPKEFQVKLNEIPELKTAFVSLTPGRQRAYLLHFSAPKQSSTRESRVEKYMFHILNGKGLNDN